MIKSQIPAKTSNERTCVYPRGLRYTKELRAITGIIVLCNSREIRELIRCLPLHWV